jgi:hypothetical protein
MRTKGMLKLVVSMAVCWLLLFVMSAGAATTNQRQSRFDQDKAPNLDLGLSAKKPEVHMRPLAGARNNNPTKSLLQSLQAKGIGYCESDCCWASGCDYIECSSSYCYAECGSSRAIYVCDAAAQ